MYIQINIYQLINYVVIGLFGYRLEPCRDKFSFSSVPLLCPWWVVCWRSLLFFKDRAREKKNDGAIGSEIRHPNLSDLNSEVRNVCIVHRKPYCVFCMLFEATGLVPLG